MYDPPIYDQPADTLDQAPWERPALPEGAHLRQLAALLADIDQHAPAAGAPLEAEGAEDGP